MAKKTTKRKTTKKKSTKKSSSKSQLKAFMLSVGQKEGQASVDKKSKSTKRRAGL
jgi:hypothetical protein